MKKSLKSDSLDSLYAIIFAYGEFISSGAVVNELVFFRVASPSSLPTEGRSNRPRAPAPEPSGHNRRHPKTIR